MRRNNFMKAYSSSADAIYDLHQQGFTHDFHLSGNDLLWVQENYMIRVGEFAIAKFYRIEEYKNGFSKCIVIGIIALHHNIKGIFINRLKCCPGDMPPVLIKKLQELSVDGVSWEKIINYSSSFHHSTINSKR